MPDMDNEYVKEKISELRMRLLDLTNRNALLNFRHSEKALTHIRIIDELPDFLFGSLLNGDKLTFKPLPEPDDEPHDEKTEEFQISFREATLTDEQYLEEVAELIDKDDCFDDLAVIERNLKNRVRESLGMPPAHELKPLSNSQWARQNNLEPKYDMPAPAEDDYKPNKHSDEYIQTLLKPKELQHKLSGLRRYINTDINETGVNTFYAAFGFLERYDSNNSERPFFSPLLLLQLDPLIEEKTADGEVFISVQASGEDPQFNLPLAEKLKEFGLQLPKFDGDDTPESYMKKVERRITNQNGWRIRRFITFGRFQFSRLVMYHDLDPDRWPADSELEKNEIINNLIAGREESTGSSGDDYASVYDIDDDPEVEQFAPILIMEADSSQHSAIVDAMKGNNIVIKGPPGTGKSQTITNLIANALAKDKKVLFIAEKMAALNVVHSRLQDVDLGDYCLELHSTKTKLEGIKKGLASTIENRRLATQPHNLVGKVAELKDAQAQLREYSNTINQMIGGTGKTIHEIIWAEQNHRDIVKDLPVSIKRIRIKNASHYSGPVMEGLCNELKQLESLEAENEKYCTGRHPWEGVRTTKASSLKAGEIIQSFEECATELDQLLDQTKIFEKEFQWTAKTAISEWREAYECCQKIQSFKDRPIDFELLKCLKSKDVLIVAKDLLKPLERYDQAMAAIGEHVNDPIVCIDNYCEILELCQEAESINVEDDTSETMDSELDKQNSQIKQLERVLVSFENIGEKVFGSNDDELTMFNFKLLLNAIRLLSAVDRETLFLRHEEAVNEANKPIIANALSKQKSLNAKKKNLEKYFDLKYSIPERNLDEAIYELSNANIFSFFKPKYHKARKMWKAVTLKSIKISSPKMANGLRHLKAYKEQKNAFEQDNRYKQVVGTSLFNGLQTNFKELAKINDWAIEVRTEFNGLDEYRDKIRQFLLRSDVSDIEAVKEETLDIDVAALLNGVGLSDDGSLSAFIAELKTSTERKEKLHTFLKENQSTQDLTFRFLKNLINTSAVEAIKCRKYIFNDKDSFKEKLGHFFNGIKTDIHGLKETALLSEYIQALDLHESLGAHVYSSNLFSFADNLFSSLQNIIKNLDKVEISLQNAQNVSELDIKNYVGAETIQDASLEYLMNAFKTSLENKEALNAQIGLFAFLDNARFQPYAELLSTLKKEGLNYKKSADIFEYLCYRTLCDKALSINTLLDIQAPYSLTEIREKFRQLDRSIIKLNCQNLAYKLSQAQPEEGVSWGLKGEYTEMGLIRHQALRQRSKSITLRSLITRAGRALQTLKPCFLMSPLSVAQYIDPHGIKFDMVVIDEASQMRPEDALGAIGRSGQIVVVGDPEQLPPTSFFRKQSFQEDDYDDEDKIDNESILDLSLGRFRPTRDLLWHYRSRHESLIAFSNAHFYNDRLIILPSPEERNENFGVHYNFVGGVYNVSCNIKETKAIVEAARNFMSKHPDKSLGLVTMNSRQRELINEEMYRLFLDDGMAEAYRKKWEDTLEPFFVKNLESVQGDERDAIFISTVYGPNKEGAVMQRFGPINGKFGHRRLNVLFTRAKHSLTLITSLKPDDIKATEASSLGLRAFKGYLEYASDGKLDSGRVTGREPDSDFEICVMEKLKSIGCEVVPQVGVNGYFIDLGIKHPNYPYGFLMGIECDGATYHSSKSARDRDRIRQDVLEGLGWEIYRIWSTDWFHNPTKEFEKLKNHIIRTLEEKAAVREKLEQDRISNVVELQQKVQRDLFTDSEEKKPEQEFFQSAISETGEQSKPRNNDIVELFDTVSFKYIDDEEEALKTVTIVASQSDVSLGNINQHSAIGRALIDSEIDEEVEVSLPNGDRSLLITEIKKYKDIGPAI